MILKLKMLNKCLIKTILIKAFKSKKYYISLLICITLSIMSLLILNKYNKINSKHKDIYNIVLSTNSYFLNEDFTKYIDDYILVKSYKTKLNIYSKEYSINISNMREKSSIKNGKKPSIINEGAITNSFSKKHKINIGDIVLIKDNILKVKKIKIVGITNDNTYQKDSLYILDEAFDKKNNTVLFKLNDIKKIKEIKKKLIKTLNTRYENILMLSNNTIENLNIKKQEINNSNIIYDTKLLLTSKIDNEIIIEQKKLKNTKKINISSKNIYNTKAYKDNKRKASFLKILYFLSLIIISIKSILISKNDFKSEKEIINTLFLFRHNKFKIFISYLISYILRYILIILIILFLLKKISIYRYILITILPTLSYILTFLICLKNVKRCQ